MGFICLFYHFPIMPCNRTIISLIVYPTFFYHFYSKFYSIQLQFYNIETKNRNLFNLLYNIIDLGNFVIIAGTYSIPLKFLFIF